MDAFLSWLTHPAAIWFAAVVVGGMMGAIINGIVVRRLRSLGGVQFLRTRIVALNPRNHDALASNSYLLELRMQNTSDEPKVVESLMITFNLNKRGTGRTSPVRLASPTTTLISNDPVVGMNMPFRLQDQEGNPLEYVVVPPRDLKIVQVQINTETFNFAGAPEPRRDANDDLALAFQGSHVLIHFRYPCDKRLRSQLIIDVTERQGWEYRGIVYFPAANDGTQGAEYGS